MKVVRSGNRHFQDLLTQHRPKVEGKGYIGAETRNFRYPSGRIHIRGTERLNMIFICPFNDRIEPALFLWVIFMRKNPGDIKTSFLQGLKPANTHVMVRKYNSPHCVCLVLPDEWTFSITYSGLFLTSL